MRGIAFALVALTFAATTPLPVAAQCYGPECDRQRQPGPPPYYNERQNFPSHPAQGQPYRWGRMNSPSRIVRDSTSSPSHIAQDRKNSIAQDPKSSIARDRTNRPNPMARRRSGNRTSSTNSRCRRNRCRSRCISGPPIKGSPGRRWVFQRTAGHAAAGIRPSRAARRARHSHDPRHEDNEVWRSQVSVRSGHSHDRKKRFAQGRLRPGHHFGDGVSRPAEPGSRTAATRSARPGAPRRGSPFPDVRPPAPGAPQAAAPGRASQAPSAPEPAPAPGRASQAPSAPEAPL